MSSIGSGSRVYSPPSGASVDPGEVVSSPAPTRLRGETARTPGLEDSFATKSAAQSVDGDVTGTALDREIYDNVFAPHGIPNPYGASTESRARELANDPAFRAAVDAGKAYLRDATATQQEAFLASIRRLPKDGNVMETLLLVIRGSIEEANEDKKYHLKKLQEMNEISAFLGDQMKIFANRSTELAELERGSDDPGDMTVRLDYALPDVRVVGEDGRPLESERFTIDVNRDALGVEMKKLEAAQEEVKNNKTEYQTAFQAVDSKVNQLYQIMASVSKTMNEERGAPIKNML